MYVVAIVFDNKYQIKSEPIFDHQILLQLLGMTHTYVETKSSGNLVYLPKQAILDSPVEKAVHFTEDQYMPRIRHPVMRGI